MSSMFKTLEEIEDYLRGQDEEVVDKLISAYNVSIGFVQPITIEQHEELMWLVLNWFDLI